MSNDADKHKSVRKRKRKFVNEVVKNHPPSFADVAFYEKLSHAPVVCELNHKWSSDDLPEVPERAKKRHTNGEEENTEALIYPNWTSTPSRAIISIRLVTVVHKTLYDIMADDKEVEKAADAVISMSYAIEKGIEPYLIEKIASVHPLMRHVTEPFVCGDGMTLEEAKEHLKLMEVVPVSIPIACYLCVGKSSLITGYMKDLGFPCPIRGDSAECFVYDYGGYFTNIVQQTVEEPMQTAILDTYTVFHRALLVHLSSAIRGSIIQINVIGIPITTLKNVFGGHRHDIITDILTKISTFLRIPETLLYLRCSHINGILFSPANTDPDGCPSNRDFGSNPLKDLLRMSSMNLSNEREEFKKTAEYKKLKEKDKKAARRARFESACSEPKEFHCKECEKITTEMRIFPLFLLPFFLSLLPQPYINVNPIPQISIKRIMRDLASICDHIIGIRFTNDRELEPDSIGEHSGMTYNRIAYKLLSMADDYQKIIEAKNRRLALDRAFTIETKYQVSLKEKDDLVHILSNMKREIDRIQTRLVILEGEKRENDRVTDEQAAKEMYLNRCMDLWQKAVP